MLSLSDSGWTDIVEALDSTSRCLDGFLVIDVPCYGLMVGPMCPAGLQLNRANSSGFKTPFLGLGLSITGGMVSSGICGGGDFGFEVVGFPFLDGNVPHSCSYCRCVFWC